MRDLCWSVYGKCLVQFLVMVGAIVSALRTGLLSLRLTECCIHNELAGLVFADVTRTE